MTYWQSIVIGFLQGVTELFPVSSLGHSVIVPAWLGWHTLVQGQSANESFYLAFLVGLHVATAIALLVRFRRDWARIIRGFFSAVAKRSITTPDERLAMLIVLASIPVGIVGLAMEHTLRTIFAKPAAAAGFLTVNGLLLIGAERLKRRGGTRSLASFTTKDAIVVGTAQIGSLFAGISRSGITMSGGLLRGLDHEDAAKFSFLLATPIIFAAGAYKIPDLLGPNGNGIRGQIVVGSIVAGLAAYGAVRFLERFFRTKTLYPFAVYCLIAGAISFARFV